MPESANEEDNLLEERWLAELEEETDEVISEPETQVVEEIQESPQADIAANLDAVVEEALEEEKYKEYDDEPYYWQGALDRETGNLSAEALGDLLQTHYSCDTGYLHEDKKPTAGFGQSGQLQLQGLP